MKARFSVWPLACVILVTAHASSDGEQTTQWGVIAHGFQMALEFEKPHYTPDAPIVATVCLKNISPEIRYARESYPEADFEISIIDSQGKTPEFTADWKRKKHEPLSLYRNFLRKLSPGEAVQHQLILTKMYRLDAPEIYRVIVRRTVLDPTKKEAGEVESNPVEVIVKPP